jgi:tRNA(Ile)-lysidine synthetase-like protein
MIQRTVLDTQRQYNLFPPDTTIILAVSGGADSLVLLHVMAQLQARLHIRLHVATLNHGLRADAADDVAYVQHIAAQLNVPITAETVDVNTLAKVHRMGIEAAGRKARYDFFARVAQQIGASTIATAHHADDQSETILMHIIRGAGVQGLSGMQPKVALPDYPALTLVRPLLDVRRLEIEAYCSENQLEPRHDSTNTDTTYLRNELRHVILPRLREINPQLDKSLAQLADIVSVEQDFMQTQYTAHVTPHISTDETASRIRVPRAIFQDWHSALQRRFIIESSSQLGAEATYAHITAAVQTAAQSEVGAVAQLTNGVRLRVGYDEINIELESAPLPDSNYWLIDTDYPVAVPGQTDCGIWSLEVTSEAQPDTIARLQFLQNSNVILRTRQTGDKFQPLGMGGRSKTVKNWMIDCKIPRHLRDRIPLLLVDNQIAAIILPYEWVIAEPFAVADLSQHKFYFSIRKM